MNYETNLKNADQQAILSNIVETRKRITEAGLRTGLQQTVKLLLATKTVSPEKIRVAIEAGERLIGENKVQELRKKHPALADLEFERHFIGHLQTNKIKEVIQYVSCIQSVDRIDLAEELDTRLQMEGRPIDILIQVNTSFEASKFGVLPNDALTLIKAVNKFDTISLKGLMTIGLFNANPHSVRPSFTLLREIRDKAISEGVMDPGACELSMGMSGDMEIAIEEGATMVRAGTAIFGKRIYPDSYYWNEKNKDKI